MDAELLLHLRQPAQPEAGDHLEQQRHLAHDVDRALFQPLEQRQPLVVAQTEKRGEAPEQERRTEHDQPDAGAHARDELERRRIQQIVEEASERRVRGSPGQALADARG